MLNEDKIKQWQENLENLRDEVSDYYNERSLVESVRLLDGFYSRLIAAQEELVYILEQQHL